MVWQPYYPYGVQVISIGRNETVQSANNWVNTYNLTYPVLADVTGSVTRNFLGTFPVFPWDVIAGTDWVVAFTGNSYQGGNLNMAEITAVFESLFDPQPQVSPNNLTFGQVEVGQTQELTLVLDNAGTGVLDLLNITSTSTAFSASPTQDSVLAMEDSLVITVEFAPDQAGIYEDTLTLQTASGNLTIPVSGTATAAGVEPNAILPGKFAVTCYPNPFNAELTVQLTLDHDQVVEANLYSISGDKMGALYRGWLASGSHEVRWADDQAPSGIYLLKVTGANWTEVRKVVLVR